MGQLQAVRCACGQRAFDATGISVVSALRTCVSTEFQSPRGGCRNSCMVGYQTDVEPLIVQRQSWSACSSVHVLTPSAPARCAIMVSTEITRSSSHTLAAVVLTSSLPRSGTPDDVISAAAGPY